MRTNIARILWVAGTPVRGLLIALLLGYRHSVGVLVAGRCRFHPTCSSYALEAVRTHGAGKGSALAVWRVLRCSPLHPGGLDPVPPRGRWRVEAAVR